MKGDDRSRHCAQCNLNVHNFEAMTTDEVLAVLQNTQGRVCARLFRREDGKILTADCPVGLALVRAKARRTAGRLIAVLGTIITTGVLWAKGHNSPFAQARLTMLEPFATVHAKLSPAPPPPFMGKMVMGDICLPANSNNNLNNK